MGNAKKFIINGLLLTATSLLLRWIGVIFNAFISKSIGSEGMGGYSLVMSIFGFAVTFACSGINLGTTRLVSEAVACNDGKGAKKTVLICSVYSLIFSITACLVLYLGADYVGKTVLGDARTVRSVRILAFSLPFISLSSVFSGYFTAVRRVYKNAVALILEQLIQVAFTTQLLVILGQKEIEYTCSAVAYGILLSEVSSLLFNAAAYHFDIRLHKLSQQKYSNGITKRLLGISIPLSLSAYIRSGLVTVEHLLIPYSLRRSGVEYSLSMATYGMIQGMVFPLLMFPSCLIYSFSGLVVPELSALNKQNKKSRIDSVITAVVRYATVYSICVAGIMMCYAYELSLLLYNNTEVYQYIKLIAPLIAVMYLDGAVDGILKGMNEQVHSMKINIIDAALSVLLVYILVPLWGIKGYIITIFVCEIVNCTLSLSRLVKIAAPTISLKYNLIFPVVNIIGATSLVTVLFEKLGLTQISSAVNLTIRITLTAVIYLSLFVLEEKINKTTTKPALTYKL